MDFFKDFKNKYEEKLNCVVHPDKTMKTGPFGCVFIQERTLIRNLKKEKRESRKKGSVVAVPLRQCLLNLFKKNRNI